jgi:peptidoglycan/LPS O-acetylase OafA/YrhL
MQFRSLSVATSACKSRITKPQDDTSRLADATHHHRYLTLDALRGVAALAVVVFHIPELFGLPAQKSSSLAVDLFFILSGFVVEHAYGDHLRHEMTFSRFITVRMIRLYPLYIIGLITYTLFFMARPNVAAASVVPGALLALFYLPTPPSISFEPQFLFPVNPVSWSLFCELLVNVLYALFMVRLSARYLFSIIVVFGVVLVVEKTYLQAVVDTFGPWSVLLDGIPRALFSFFAGVLLYGLARKPKSCAASPIAILLLIAIFAFNFGKQVQPIYELVVILMAFPALVFYAALTIPHTRLSQVYDLLGTISYPTYVIHMPLVLWISAFFPRVIGRGLASLAPWSGSFLIFAILITAYLLDKKYDQPVRRWLRQRLIR